MESARLKKLIIRSIVLVLTCLSYKIVLSSNPIITISGIEEGNYYSTAVYPEISISDTDLAYSSVTLKYKKSADSTYISGVEIKKDGWYCLSASAFDSAANASYESVNFTIDKSKSAISIKGVNNNAYYNSGVWFKVRISETNPVKEDIMLDGKACVENETVWVNEEGAHELVVDTLDKAGNENVKEYSFTVDKTLPLINISGVKNLPDEEGNQYYTTFVTPQISAIDDNYDSGGIKITLNGEMFINGTEIKEDGDFILNVTVSDFALNKSEEEIHFKVRVSPKLSIITRPGEAAVYLDGDYSVPGKYQGVTTAGDENKLIIENNLSCGKHLLKIKKPGYVDHIELVDFGIGELIEKNIDLILCRKEYFNEGRLLDLDLSNISLRPWVTDYDQDGKKDLVVRTSDGKDYLYLNTGEDNTPKFDSGVSINSKAETFFDIFYLSGIESPSSSVKGSSRGQIYFDSKPVLINYETVDVGGHSWPFVFDFDYDGRNDLISGAQNGKIYFFKNIGIEKDEILFDSAALIQAGADDLDIGSYSRPFVIDWNNDGLYDLLIGSSKGVYLYLAADSSYVYEEEEKDPETGDIILIPPSNLNAETGIGGQVLLKWEENKHFDLLGYNIYRDSTKINKTLYVDGILRYTQDEQLLRQLNYSDTGLVDGTQYVYFIRAVDVNGKESKNSNEVWVIPEDTSAPSLPINLCVSNSGLLSWDPPVAEDSDLAGYYLYINRAQNTEDRTQKNEERIDIENVYSYQVTGLFPGIQYLFAVSAYDNYNKESEKSNIVSFLFSDAQSPAQVKGVRIRDTGKTGELIIKWQENNEPDLSGYKIYYSSKADRGVDPSEYYASCFVEGKAEFVLSGLNDACKYFIAVSCVDTQGNEGLKSYEKIGIPRGNSTFIPSPEALIIDPLNKGVRLNWNAVPNIDGYKIYFSMLEGLITVPLIISDTTFVFNNLLNSNKYYAAVSSFKGKDESARISGIAVPKDGLAPDVLSRLICLSGNDAASLILSWNLNKEWDLAGYKIAYKTNQEYFSDPVIIGKTNKFDMKNLIEGEQYIIVLFAYDEDGNISDPSIIRGVPGKNNYTYNEPPSAPLLDISCENGSVRLTWISACGNIEDYRIYRREAGKLKYKKIYKTKNLTYRNKAVEEGKTYYYVVTAFKGGCLPEESTFSNEVVMRPKLKMGNIEIEGDVPVEGRVDGYDLITLSVSFGAGVGDVHYNPNADLNGDGTIDGIDLSILANNFGKQY